MADRKRNCNQEKDFEPRCNQTKQICLFIDQKEYDRILFECEAFRWYWDNEIKLHSELFLAAIEQGYKMYDILPESKNMPGIRLRRIELYTGDILTPILSPNTICLTLRGNQ